LTTAGVIAALSVPGPLVPAVEGLLFIGLLIWAQLEFASRRNESTAYRQHVAAMQDFAKEARETGLFMNFVSGGRSPVVNPIKMLGARAEDFRKHYPQVAKEVDEWNELTSGYRQMNNRFIAITHREAEKATSDRATTLPMLLGDLGRGEIDPGEITWRMDGNRFEASYAVSIFNEPVFSPIISNGPTADDVERCWSVVAAFSDLPEVREWRARVDEERRLRPLLTDSLEHAEYALGLKGKCEHCPA